MWVWQSIRPGSTVFFERSTTSAPAGIASPGPTAVMRSPWMRITASRIGAPPRPSISRPARTATIRGGLAGAGSAAASGPKTRERPASVRQAKIQAARFIGHLMGLGFRGAYRKRVRSRDDKDSKDIEALPDVPGVPFVLWVPCRGRTRSTAAELTLNNKDVKIMLTFKE